jgi:hypothetical protein
MKLRAMARPLAEQAVASGFNFCLFLAVVRLLSGPDLAAYTAFYSINQSFVFFLFGFVLLPVASASGVDTSRQIGVSLTFLGALIVVFASIAPLAIGFFSALERLGALEAWLLAIVFFSSQCFFETGRWLTIRMLGSRSAFTVSVLRFAGFFAAVLALGGGRLDVWTFTIIHAGVNFIGAAMLASRLRGVLGGMRFALPDRTARRNLAIFGNTAAAFVTNLTVVALVDRGLGSTGLTAFQALRSASNIVGVISQVLDNHYSASLARRGETIRWVSQAKALVAAVLVVTLVVSVLVREEITGVLFGQEIAAYAALLPLLVLASFIHMLTRPFFIDWRLRGDTRILNFYSLVIVLGGLPAIALLGLMQITYPMVFLSAILPGVAWLLNFWLRQQEPVVGER